MRNNKSSSRRRGTVLIAVLVCLGFATSVLLGTVQTTLQLRREIRKELQIEQTKWLMDLGVRKAIANAGQQPGYDGETITVSPAPGRYADASVEISVVRENQTDGEVRLKITAQLSASGHFKSSTTRRSTEIVVDANTKKSK